MYIGHIFYSEDSLYPKEQTKPLSFAAVKTASISCTKNVCTESMNHKQ